MNKKALLIAVFAAVTIFCGSYSQAGEPGINLFKQIDTNKDGFITMDEIKSHHKKFFDEIDTNKDGIISKEEAKAAGKDLSQFGNKQDKGITFADSLKIEENRFTETDTNKDGKVSLEEYKAHFNANQ